MPSIHPADSASQFFGDAGTVATGAEAPDKFAEGMAAVLTVAIGMAAGKRPICWIASGRSMNSTDFGNS